MNKWHIAQGDVGNRERPQFIGSKSGEHKRLVDQGAFLPQPLQLLPTSVRDLRQRQSLVGACADRHGFQQWTSSCGINVDEKTVVAQLGVGSLFDLLKVKGVVEALAPIVPGRLLVFFPGNYEDNNYRLLDGYDGWNYLAIPITADKQ